MRPLGFRQRPLDRLKRRASRRLRVWLGRRPPRSQRVYRVTINGRHFKRLLLPDSHHAASFAANLREFADDDIYPRLILERGRELWVEFLEGRPVSEPDPDTLDQLARILAVLNSRRPRRVPLAETPYLHAIRVDLAFLEQVGVLAGDVRRELAARAEALAPAEVWVGYDCTDTILKNFLLCDDGRLRGIDIESLGADQLIGSGTAKACVRWLGEHREHFLERLGAHGAPDFQRYLPFVELSFLSFWTKSSFLEGKERFVDGSLFERFRS